MYLNPASNNWAIRSALSPAEEFLTHQLGNTAGAVAGNAAQQGLGLAMGARTRFDWEELGQAAIQGSANSVAAWGINRALFEKTCFETGTRLLTPEGSQAIELLRVGDLVLSRAEDDPTGPLAAKVVEEVFTRQGRVLRLRVRGQEIGTTAEHPFWVYNRGWLPAGELRVGDWLLSHDGQWVVVEEVQDSGRVETVYNLRVADFHTYFVGCQTWGFSVWAHNEYTGLRGGLSDEELVRYGTAYLDSLDARVADGFSKANWKQIEAATDRTFDQVERMAIRRFVADPEGLAFVMSDRGLSIQVSNPDGPEGSPATQALNRRWAKSFVDDVGANVEAGPPPYGNGEHWLTDPVTGERVGRLDLQVRVPASEGLVDPLIEINTITMKKIQGQLVPHPQEEVLSALAIRAHLDELGVGGTMILIPKTPNGSFYLVPPGGANPVPIPEFADARGLVNYLKQGG
jgi:hypothetical protein